MLNKAREIIDELREFKTPYENLGVKFTYTPSVCERAADLIEMLLNERWNRVSESALPSAEVIASYKSNLLTFEEAAGDNSYLERNGDEYVDMALNIYAAYCSEIHPDDCIMFKTHSEDRITLFRSNYNKTWRCWRFRPTQAEREATPWEE